MIYRHKMHVKSSIKYTGYFEQCPFETEFNLI